MIRLDPERATRESIRISDYADDGARTILFRIQSHPTYAMEALVDGKMEAVTGEQFNDLIRFALAQGWPKKRLGGDSP